jgi:MFS family permease
MGQERPLLLFMLVFQLAIQISSPFVASYLIGEIGFSNATYFAAAATLFATKSVAVSIFGSIASRRGPRFVLVLSAGFLTAHAALFALPPETSTLFILMALSGICWAGYEIATFLLLLDVSKPEERTSILTSFNLLNALALVAGSLVGGSLLHWLGDDRKAYALLFLISAGARLAALSLLRFVRDTRGSKSDQKEAHPSNLQEISMEEDGSFNRPPESIL